MSDSVIELQTLLDNSSVLLLSEPTKAYLSKRIKELTPDKPAKRVGCNRHSNCEQAAKDWLMNHHMEKYVPINFHCHDDECEECFGN